MRAAWPRPPAGSRARDDVPGAAGPTARRQSFPHRLQEGCGSRSSRIHPQSESPGSRLSHRELRAPTLHDERLARPQRGPPGGDESDTRKRADELVRGMSRSLEGPPRRSGPAHDHCISTRGSISPTGRSPPMIWGRPMVETWSAIKADCWPEGGERSHRRRRRQPSEGRPTT